MKEWSGTIQGSKSLDNSGVPVGAAISSGRICYVDDSKTSAYVTQKILAEQGFQIDHYDAAEPAVVAVLQQDYDLLVTDLTLDNTGMDGDDLVRFIRRSGHPQKKILPMIVITGNTEKDTLLRIYESGANAVLVKPISGDVLVDKVRDLLPGKPVMPPIGGYQIPRQPLPSNSPPPQSQATHATTTVPPQAPPQQPVIRPRPQQNSVRPGIGSPTMKQAARSPATPPKPRIPAGGSVPTGNRVPARPTVKAPPQPPVMRQPVMSPRMQTQPPIPDHLLDLPDSPFASGSGTNLTQTLKDAVKSAVEKIGEKSRQGLERLAHSHHGQVAARDAKSDAGKKQINDAAALIAKLRAQARAKASRPSQPSTPQPAEQAPAARPTAARPAAPERNNETAVQAASRRAAQSPRNPENLTPPKPAAQQADAPRQAKASDNKFNIEQVQPSETDFANLFSGLVPGQEASPVSNGDAAEPIANDKKMITALDINLDLVNFQDTMYQNAYGSIGSDVMDKIATKVREYKIIIGAAIIAGLLLFTGIGDFLTGSRAVDVETVRVGLGNIHQAIIVPGKIVSNMKVEVSPSSPGQIVSLKVTEGSDVKKGQVLAELENEQAISDVKRAEGNLMSAEEETALAEKTWKRMRHAFQLGAVSRYAVEEAEASLKSAKAREAVTKEEVRSTRLSLGKLSIIAPFSGTVTSRHVQVGQWVSPSEAIFTLVDLTAKEIEVKIDSSDSTSIKVGQPVSLTSDAYPGNRWMESVTRIATAANREDTANTVSVFISLGSQAPELRFGQQVDAEIRTSSSSNIIKLPIEALITRNGKTWVAVVEDGKLHFSPVVIGLEDFTHVEILQGVKPRQEVILPRDATAFHEGDSVRVIATQTVE